MLEKTIYTGCGVSGNGNEEMKTNKEIYKELKEKYRIKRKNDDDISDDNENYDLVFKFDGHDPYSDYFEILSNKAGLNPDELALILSGGELYFGYKKIGNIIEIYTD